jgi:hypothetical protein
VLSRKRVGAVYPRGPLVIVLVAAGSETAMQELPAPAIPSGHPGASEREESESPEVGAEPWCIPAWAPRSAPSSASEACASIPGGHMDAQTLSPMEAERANSARSAARKRIRGIIQQSFYHSCPHGSSGSFHIIVWGNLPPRARTCLC